MFTNVSCQSNSVRIYPSQALVNMVHYIIQSEQEKGVVYPGDVEVPVVLNSSIICSTISSSGARCMDIARDVYNVTINQTNDIGSTTSHSLQDCK